MKKLWKNKDFRVFVFTVFNSLIAFLLALWAMPEYAQYSVFLIPFLNALSKFINTTFFNDIGVLKDDNI